MCRQIRRRPESLLAQEGIAVNQQTTNQDSTKLEDQFFDFQDTTKQAIVRLKQKLSEQTTQQETYEEQKHYILIEKANKLLRFHNNNKVLSTIEKQHFIEEIKSAFSGTQFNAYGVWLIEKVNTLP